VVRVKRELIKQFSDQGVTYALFRVPCGKANCRKCPHGPYWYARFWLRGKMQERYVGKSLMEVVGKGFNISEERRSRLREIEELRGEGGGSDGLERGVGKTL